jgi:hypothetical protein
MPCVPLCAYPADFGCVAWKTLQLGLRIGNFISHTAGGLLEFARG